MRTYSIVGMNYIKTEEIVAALKPGTAVKFGVLRRDEKMELSLTPGLRPKPRRPAP